MTPQNLRVHALQLKGSEIRELVRQKSCALPNTKYQLPSTNLHYRSTQKQINLPSQTASVFAPSASGAEVFLWHMIITDVSVRRAVKNVTRHSTLMIAGQHRSSRDRFVSTAIAHSIHFPS
jgi:hypothetical protein